MLARERAQRFVIEFAEILMRMVKLKYRQISSLLAVFLSQTSVQMTNFRQYIKTLPDCKYFITRITRELVKYNVFHHMPVRGNSAKNGVCGTPYEKDTTEVLSRPVNLCGKDFIMLRPEENSLSRAVSSTMTTKYIRT